MRKSAAILAACLFAAACQHTSAPSPAVPPMTGAAPATMFAAFITADVTAILAPSDRPHVELALIRAFNSAEGEQVIWSNPETQHHGFVQPTGMGTSADGRACREFRQMISASGQRAWISNKACREEDGTWSRVSP
jgi:surface antigen